MLKMLVVTHRWLGIVLGPLFAMWFATGIVIKSIPLLFVARLPRNSTGKLPQEALMALAASHLKTSVA